MEAAIRSTIAAGIPIIRHVRTNLGMIAPSAQPDYTISIRSGLINCQKARIQLQLALATGADPRAAFEDVLRKELYGESSGH
jgi:L-asparaginase